MPRYHGIEPQPATRLAAEAFERDVMIQKDHRFLVARVYLDMESTRWAVAVAYNPSRSPGIGGYEHLLEVRYSYEPRSGHRIQMFRSDPLENSPIPCRRFLDPDAFVQFVLAHEREMVSRRV